MTSNIASQHILDAGGAGRYDVMRERVLEELRRHFRTESLNRVDETVVFEALPERQRPSCNGLRNRRMAPVACVLSGSAAWKSGCCRHSRCKGTFA